MKRFPVPLSIIAAALCLAGPAFATTQRLLSDEFFWEGPRGPRGRLTLKADPAAFSPNGDDRQDSAFFVLGIQGVPEISRWSIVVKNARGKTVKRFSGQGSPPGLIEWTGTDLKNNRLPEGAFEAYAQVWGKNGRAASQKIALTLDVSPPQAEVLMATSTFSPDGDGIDDAAAFRWKGGDKHGMGAWTCRIQLKGGDSSVVHAASGNFTVDGSTFSWDGRIMNTGETAPNGPYSVLCDARDAAGNETIVPPIDLELRIRPETVLANLSSFLTVLSTARGYEVALPSGKLFSPSNGTNPADDDEVRNRLVHLIKAFPDHKVLLEGFVGSEKTPARRTEVSSAQAWSLYSFLVKSGVPAARLGVHGRGGEPGTPNRVQVTLIKPPQVTKEPPAPTAGTGDHP